MMLRVLLLACALAGCGRVGFDPTSRAVDATPDTTDAIDPDAAPVCTGHAGPASLLIPAASPFCIDSTEVTNAQYAAFLATSPSTGGQPAVCTWNMNYTPNTFPFPVGQDEYPVGAMDWCDARAYCEWAGKRLCRGIGGTSIASAARIIPSQSEWMWACTAGGDGRTYPYGTGYVATTCVDAQYLGPKPAPVGSAPGCVGGFPGLHDMAGNITEWEDSCDQSVGAADDCYFRGGEFQHGFDSTSCAMVEGPYQRADGNQGTGGIRCCSDPL